MQTFREICTGGFPDIYGSQPVKIQIEDKAAVFDFVNVNAEPLKSFSFKLNIVSKKISFAPEDIIEVDYGRETYRSAGKTATGAIIGGILTGGIGLLAGAAMGGKRRKEDNLTLVVSYKGEYRQVLFKPSRTLGQLSAALKRLADVEQPPHAPKSAASEVAELFKLKQDGAITDEEFQAQKAKLLS